MGDLILEHRFSNGDEFIFRDLETVKELKALENLIRQYSLKYPAYQDWVSKAVSELELGVKNAKLAIYNGELIGNLIYQNHKELQGWIEVKNLRVQKDVREKGIGYFLMKQLEPCLKKQKGIIIDMRSTQKDVHGLCSYMHYEEVARKELYEKNEQEIIMAKTYNPKFLKETKKIA